MKITVEILLILPALVVGQDLLREFSAKTEVFQNQVNQQVRGVKNSFSLDSSLELLQMWLSVDETMGDMENMKRGISGMMEEAEVNCVDECPTKYDEIVQEAEKGYQQCLAETHRASEILIKDFLQRVHKEWRDENNLQIAKLYDVFHGELRGESMNDTIQNLEEEVRTRSLAWDNVAIVDLKSGESVSKEELRSRGISTFTCFMIVRNGLFGRIKEIEAFLNDNCFESPRNPLKIDFTYPRV